MGVLEQWSAKVEYDFYNFNTRTLALPGTIAGAPEVVPGVDIKETIHTVKIRRQLPLLLIG